MNARKKVCRNVEIGHRDANKKWHEAEALEVVVSVIALFACPASSDLLRLRCMLEACYLFESAEPFQTCLSVRPLCRLPCDPSRKRRPAAWRVRSCLGEINMQAEDAEMTAYVQNVEKGIGIDASALLSPTASMSCLAA